jgi:predicted metal-dependent phosphoesterase TrpH
MAFADLHIHSIYSYDATSTIPAILKYIADCTDLKVIAITDHDSVNGVREAMQLAPKYGIEVIPGCEVSTSEGHLLTLFIKDRIPPGLSLNETVLQTAKMGGLCIAPHLNVRGTPSISSCSLLNAIHNPDVAQTLIGIETYNCGLVLTRSKLGVQYLADQYHLATLGNSDSHILSMISEGSTEFSGKTAAELRVALEARQTVTREGKGVSGASILGKYIPQYILRVLGWATWNESPQCPLKYIHFEHARYNLNILKSWVTAPEKMPA